jgi:hypothetical protein
MEPAVESVLELLWGMIKAPCPNFEPGPAPSD